MPNECETAITDVKEDQSGIDTIGLYTAKQLVSYYWTQGCREIQETIASYERLS